MLIVIVDDDALSAKISQMIVSSVIPEAEVAVFTSPRGAISSLSQKIRPQNLATILLLDIHMGEMSAWEFINELSDLHKDCLNNMAVHILTASIRPKDIELATANVNVKSYIEKPLSAGKVKKIIEISEQTPV